ncbi:hypothetical protein FXV77_21700 [Sphingobacterium phlebotomi]|uniref:Uncharacterized protein n=1 Tax=Sphingobacterium phlebotomi TaxID=2605433 RepID=A0A5D4GQ09_9SPHI|nr:hypothetical protein [Sphingobacterium phlebotomi]TYR30816.1 hypothetical protein FXV77_21700 [Sphingobacterium phlebotomi]
MAKEVTNHQLGIALASLIEQQEKTQKKSLQEQERILGELKDLEQRFNERISNVNFSVDTTDLSRYNEEIARTSREASEKTKKALNSFILSPYLIMILFFLVGFSAFSIWFSFSKVSEVQKKVDEMQGYYDHTTEYFKEHPKDWDKIKNWKNGNNN